MIDDHYSLFKYIPAIKAAVKIMASENGVLQSQHNFMTAPGHARVPDSDFALLRNNETTGINSNRFHSEAITDLHYVCPHIQYSPVILQASEDLLDEGIQEGIAHESFPHKFATFVIYGRQIPSIS